MKNNNRNTRNTRTNINQFYNYNADIPYKQNELDNITYTVIDAVITVSIIVFGVICIYAFCTMG